MTRLESLIEQLITEIKGLRKDLSVTANRTLKATDGKTLLRPDVQGVAMYDIENDRFQNFGTWEQPQTFNNDIYLALGQKIYMDGTGKSYITMPSVNKFELYTNDILRFQIFAAVKFWLNFNMNGKNVTNMGYLQFSFDTTPPISANKTYLYQSEVGGVKHVFAADEVGNAFDLTV